MTEKPMTAIGFAAKSTVDSKGSIPTQLEDCRTLAAQEGLELRAEFSDEAASAYSGDRGPGLAQALAEAERLAAEHGTCALLVQHSDRLARGDGGQARHLVEIVLWARKASVTLRSVQDPQTFDGMGLVYAALMGDRNHEDSARKSAATRDGLRRRKDRSQPVGPIPLGYAVNQDVVNGQVIATRVIDPGASKVIERMFSMVEHGATFGDVARALNADGLHGRRGGTWVSRSVREMVHNEAYAGAKGYPELIDPHRWQRIQDGLRRLDPAAVQCRKGGRKGDPSYWLRGTAFCLDCGSALYTRHQAAGRMYVCAHRRQGTGLCHAEPIPAALIEGHVLDHLEAFIGDAEAWLALQAQERDDGRQGLLQAAQRLREDQHRIDRRRELVLADYEAALAEGDPNARIVLNVAAKLDTEHEALNAKIGDADAIAAEWQDVDDSGLEQSVDLVRALTNADTAEALKRALSRALVGIYARLSDGKLRAEFELTPPDGRIDARKQCVYLFQHVEPDDPYVDGDQRLRFRDRGETVRSTFV